MEFLPLLRDLAPCESAVEAIRLGAADYLAKPCTPEQLRLAARKQSEASRLETRLVELEARLKDPLPGADLASASPTMRQVLETARSVADTDATVLIQGESGTGKGAIARAVHGWSRRWASIPRRCGANASPRLCRGSFNFVRPHWTTGEVPAVRLGIMADPLCLEEILMMQKTA